MIRIELNKDFNLCNTVTCGQIFRYIKEDNGSYTIILSDRVINIKQDNNVLFVESNNEDNLRDVILNYFDLKRDYKSINDKLISMDKKIVDSVNNSIGLTMIKQEPLECLISYIISANNSVRNIQNSLNLISEKYGDKVLFNNKFYYLFPSLDKLSTITINEFRECKVGFRDKYLFDAIKKIKDKEFNLDKINEMNSCDALEYLKSLKGIGTKVASCILLFSYSRLDVFPIDTWVKKKMLSDYGIVGEENIRKYCMNTYKEYSGIAIQYMFNGSRNK